MLTCRNCGRLKIEIEAKLIANSFVYNYSPTKNNLDVSSQYFIDTGEISSSVITCDCGEEAFTFRCDKCGDYIKEVTIVGDSQYCESCTAKYDRYAEEDVKENRVKININNVNLTAEKERSL